MTTITTLFSDPELYSLLVKKDREGFDYLYDKYCSLLYGLTLQSSCLKEYSDEIIELTFINIYNSIHLFQSQEIRLNIWIISVLIQTTKSYLDSKNISYTFIKGNFPLFSFKLPEEKTVPVHHYLVPAL